MGLRKEFSLGVTVRPWILPAAAAHTCVPVVKTKCVCHWHSRQVLSVKHNNLAERKQTREQAQKQNKAYLDNSFKHVGERQERYQSIIWGRIDCAL